MKKCTMCGKTYGDNLEKCPECNRYLQTVKERKPLNLNEWFNEHKTNIILASILAAFILGIIFRSIISPERNKNKNLMAQNQQLVSENQQLASEKGQISNEYQDYKNKMQPYETQQQTDAKAAEEKKSVEEQAKKEANEKADREAETAKANATQNYSQPSSMVITKDYKPTGKEPNWIELVSYCEVQLPKVIGYDASISLAEEDTHIVKTGHRYKIETDLLKLKSDKSYHKAIFILEFDDSYENYHIDTAEVDNIKLK